MDAICAAMASKVAKISTALFRQSVHEGRRGQHHDPHREDFGGDHQAGLLDTQMRRFDQAAGYPRNGALRRVAKRNAEADHQSSAIGHERSYRGHLRLFIVCACGFFNHLASAEDRTVRRHARITSTSPLEVLMK